MSRFAVIFGFCTLLAGTQEIITSMGEHRGPNLMFMSLKHPPLLPASIAKCRTFPKLCVFEAIPITP
jgi:hypothetical protein